MGGPSPLIGILNGSVWQKIQLARYRMKYYLGNVRIYTLNDHEGNGFVHAMRGLALVVHHDAVMVKTSGTIDVHVVGLITKSTLIEESCKVLSVKKKSLLTSRLQICTLTDVFTDSEVIVLGGIQHANTSDNVGSIDNVFGNLPVDLRDGSILESQTGEGWLGDSNT